MKHSTLKSKLVEILKDCVITSVQGGIVKDIIDNRADQIIDLVKKVKKEVVGKIEIEGIFMGKSSYCNVCKENFCKCPKRDKGGNWLKLPSNAEELIEKLEQIKKDISK